MGANRCPPRHWLLLALIATLLVVGALLIVAAGNRSAPAEEAGAEAPLQSAKLDK